MTLKRRPTAFITAGIIASASILLTGCSERTTTASVTGINYTDENIAGFQVIQPDDFDNRSPTQEAMAYGAGGQMCCYSLPYEWHDGLKVELKVEPDIDLPVFDDQYQREYDKRRNEGTLYRDVEVPVSQYAPGKAQLLWIQFLPNQQYRAIATDLDPTHPDFPSDMKGWPVPSTTFRHKLWKEEVDRAKENINFALMRMNIEKSESYWKELWRGYEENVKLSEKDKNSFNGYEDDRFRQYEKINGENSYKYYSERLEKLLLNEPN